MKKILILSLISAIALPGCATTNARSVNGPVYFNSPKTVRYVDPPGTVVTHYHYGQHHYRHCRPVQAEIKRNGYVQMINATECCFNDGQWHLVSE